VSAALQAAIAGVAASLEPLWHALSGVITHVEGALSKAGTAGAAPPATAAAAPAVAGSRLLPPGGQQVMPLVEAFFTVCGLQGEVPAGPADAAGGAGGPSLSSQTTPAQQLSAEMAGEGGGASMGRAPSQRPSGAGALPGVGSGSMALSPTSGGAAGAVSGRRGANHKGAAFTR
jgi:hypothetical protein